MLFLQGDFNITQAIEEIGKKVDITYKKWLAWDCDSEDFRKLRTNCGKSNNTTEDADSKYFYLNKTTYETENAKSKPWLDRKQNHYILLFPTRKSYLTNNINKGMAVTIWCLQKVKDFKTSLNLSDIEGLPNNVKLWYLPYVFGGSPNSGQKKQKTNGDAAHAKRIYPSETSQAHERCVGGYLKFTVNTGGITEEYVSNRRYLQQEK